MRVLARHWRTCKVCAGRVRVKREASARTRGVARELYHIYTIVCSHWAESSKTFNNSLIQYHPDFKYGSFCSSSQPAKNIWNALHLEIRKGSYDISNVRHTFPMGKLFKHKPLICCLWWSQSSILTLFIIVNYVSSCNNTWIHHHV